MVDLGELRHMDVQHRAAEISDNEFSDFLMAIVPDVIAELTALRAKATAGEMYANAIGRIESALGRIGNVSVDETVREVEALVMKLRLAAGVAVRGPRFTDAHMEAAANEVADELRSALNGEGSL